MAVGLETHPSYLATGGNSGHQAINLAVHLGARKIVLLGFDMGFAEDGRRHWHGDHPRGLNNPTQANFTAWCAAAATLVEPLAALGVEIVNCSRRTALTCFPRAELEVALACP